MLPDFIPTYAVAPFFGLAANGALGLLCLIVYLTDRKYRPSAFLFLFYLALCAFFTGYTAYGLQKNPDSIVFWYRVMLAGLALLPLGQMWFLRGFLGRGFLALSRGVSLAACLLAGLALFAWGPAGVDLPLQMFRPELGVVRPASPYLRPAVYLFTLVSCFLFLVLTGREITRRRRQGPHRRATPLYLYLVGLVIWGAGGLHDIAFSLGWKSPLGETVLWLASLGLSFSLMATVSLNLAQLSRRVRQARDVFERFVPPAYLNRIAKTGLSSIRLGEAGLHDVTILYSDIRDFTVLAQALSPSRLVAFMNRYLESMATCVAGQGGTVDKYIGDAVLSIFEGEGSEKRAVDCGVLMLSRAHAIPLPTRREQRLRIGIGVTSGPVVLGTVGSRQRMDSTVMGMPVNLAARLEQASKALGLRMLASQRVVERLHPDHGHGLRALGEIWVKGGAEPVEVWEVFSNDPPELARRKLAAGRLVQQARELLTQGLVDRAAGALAKAARLAPEDRAIKRLTESVAAALLAGLPLPRPTIDLRS